VQSVENNTNEHRKKHSHYPQFFAAHTFVAAASLLYPMSHCASDEQYALLTQHSLVPHVVDEQAPVLTLCLPLSHDVGQTAHAAASHACTVAPAQGVFVAVLLPVVPHCIAEQASVKAHKGHATALHACVFSPVQFA
jgi:hypothetical protein